MAVCGRSSSTSTTSSGNWLAFRGVEAVSPPLEAIVALWDLDLRSPDGRLRADGESKPRRSSSATTALNEDDSGDTYGPGVNRAIERLERFEGRLGVEGVLGVAGGWVRCASDGSNGDDMAPSLSCGLPEAETLAFGGQGSSTMGDSIPDIRDDAVDECESSLGSAFTDEGRLSACCFDDRLDPLGPSRTKLTDDFLRVRSSWLLPTSSWYPSSSTSPIVFSSSSRSSASPSLSFPALPLVIKYTPEKVNAQPPKNLPNRLASAA